MSNDMYVCVCSCVCVRVYFVHVELEDSQPKVSCIHHIPTVDGIYFANISVSVISDWACSPPPPQNQCWIGVAEDWDEMDDFAELISQIPKQSRINIDSGGDRGDNKDASMHIW